MQVDRASEVEQLDRLERLEELAAAWSPSGGAGDELARGFALVDELTAKLTVAAGAFDAAEGWELDGATSMRAWLQEHAGMSPRQAGATARLGRRCRSWSTTAEAWCRGDLSGGQVEAISSNVRGSAAVDLFAEHESEVVPALVELSARDTATAMQGWRARADAVLGGAEPRAARRSQLHCSTTLDGRRRLDGDLSVEHGEVVDAALRSAERPDVPGEPERSPAERRADAEVDICRWYLDHHGAHMETGGDGAAAVAGARGRQRPHLNVVCDVSVLADPHGHARLLDGTPLDPATTQRLLCDADLHRTITKGRSVVLEYGVGTRVVPNGLFQALVVRDRGCRFPGCDRPPEWTEAHHVVPWGRGGPTDIGNLVLLCSRHHHLVHGQHGHRPGWHLALGRDGVLTATSPEGTARVSRPPP